MKKALLIINNQKEYIREMVHKDISLEKFKREMLNCGVDLEILTYDEIMNNKTYKDISGKHIIYSASEVQNYKDYQDEVIYELSKNNNVLPKYDLFKAHENKSYQEIYKEKVGLSSLKSISLSGLKELYSYKNKIKFPIVLKKIGGSGSEGVYLINNFKELEKKIIKMNNFRKSNIFYLKKVIKKFFLKSKYDAKYYEQDFYNGRYLLQEFIPNLSEDWKVLVFGNKYYVLNRKIRKNDFRASGSGDFEFLEPPIEVLEYAKYCYEKLGSPSISLDICIDENRECYLIEYQGLAFGPYTVIHSKWYYEFRNNIFVKKNKKSDFLREQARVYSEHINYDFYENGELK